ncbi:SPOR domain-containing protein [Aquitalea sp. FJL05]|uniref:SPOR domain-containing protein n=1 Tax=Aquitalea sp. FJL05 TaxID=2153366 RepID=UPI000F59EA3C|nr:SPOR domain-containing protein [Aquitalea sp. FJL05]RQO76040.1 SPOR domain-containing protein [Aquitalea sp. FJL05]
MTEQNQRQDPGSAPDEKDLNSKLKKRLAIAGGLVAVALAAIPVLDSMKKPKVEMTATTPVGSSGKIVNPSSAPALEQPAAEPAVESSAPAVEASAPQTDAGNSASPAAPTATPPQTPDISKTPAVASSKPVTPPAAHPAAAKPASKPAPAAPAAAAAPQAATPPVAVVTTHSASAKAAPAPLPVRSSTDSDNSVTAPPTALVKAKPEGSSLGYKLQLGLFSSMGNAEKLVKELKAKGIEAHTETRVQLGPFKTRAEADEAMAKLRNLGYTPLLGPAAQ